MPRKKGTCQTCGESHEVTRALRSGDPGFDEHNDVKNHLIDIHVSSDGMNDCPGSGSTPSSLK